MEAILKMPWLDDFHTCWKQRSAAGWDVEGDRSLRTEAAIRPSAQLETDNSHRLI